MTAKRIIPSGAGLRCCVCCCRAAVWFVAALSVVGIAAGFVEAQELDFSASRVVVDFSKRIRPWDGFGFNYVETAQTRDYKSDPQDYGGFSLLSSKQKAEIVERVFGDDGLRVGLLKMFLDPFHQSSADGPFDHRTTTENMRFFAREGWKTAKAAGRDLTIITTLYGPPAYMTRQKTWRGRDLDPGHKRSLALYLVDWVKFLREQEGLPVRFVSLHNEGEDWMRWNRAGQTDYAGHDFNMFWPPELVAEMMGVVREELDRAGLKDVGVTPGECTNWYRFGAWGYAEAIADDPHALAAIGLITSHGFYAGGFGRWFGEHQSAGIDRLRALRPELHAWVTSTSWSAMDAKNVKEHHNNIYTAKVNGIIPWAGVQRPTKWVGGDPNPGSAFTVREDGSYEVRRGYYFYQQVSRAGQPGMFVAHTSAMDSELAAIAFAASDAKNPNAFVLINLGKTKKACVLLRGNSAKEFAVYRTTDDGKDLYRSVGTIAVENDRIVYEAPGGSVTTFFAR